MSQISVSITERQGDVLDALAFLDEDTRKGARRRALQAIVDSALEAAEFAPEVRQAVRARRARRAS